MKKIVTLLLVFACITSMGFAQKPKKAEKKKETVEIRLDDMCSSCVNKINSYIAFEKGVTALDINLERSSVNVTYWENRTDTTQLRKAFTKVKMKIEEKKMVDETKEDGVVKK